MNVKVEITYVEPISKIKQGLEEQVVLEITANESGAEFIDTDWSNTLVGEQ
jgi:hypothetical protein